MEHLDEIIVMAMPFIFSGITILLESRVEAYALFMLNIAHTDGVTEKLKTEASKLTARVFIQIAFLFAVISSSISCIAFTALSPRPFLAAVALFLALVSILFWAFSWQYLPYEDLLGDRGKWMRRVKWSTVIACCALTYIVRFYPYAANSTPPIVNNSSISIPHASTSNQDNSNK